jgi:hypothetical protein
MNVAQIRVKLPESSSPTGYENELSDIALLELGHLAPKSDDHAQRPDYSQLDKRNVARVLKRAAALAEEEGKDGIPATVIRQAVDEELGVKRGPAPKPEPPPEDERGDLPDYLYDVLSKMSSARRRLKEHVNPDAWGHFGKTKDSHLVGLLVEECRDLEADLRQILPLVNPRKRLPSATATGPDQQSEPKPTAVDVALSANDRLTTVEKSAFMRRLNEMRK